jgi:hypothetical protein
MWNASVRWKWNGYIRDARASPLLLVEQCCYAHTPKLFKPFDFRFEIIRSTLFPHRILTQCLLRSDSTAFVLSNPHQLRHLGSKVGCRSSHLPHLDRVLYTKRSGIQILVINGYESHAILATVLTINSYLSHDLDLPYHVVQMYLVLVASRCSLIRPSAATQFTTCVITSIRQRLLKFIYSSLCNTINSKVPVLLHCMESLIKAACFR